MKIDQEIWRRIRYSNECYVSTSGRIMTKRNGEDVARKLSLSKGYHSIGISYIDATHTKSVHRLVLEAFRGECPEGMEASHLDGDPLNNDIGNLIWESHQDNCNRIDRSKH